MKIECLEFMGKSVDVVTVNTVVVGSGAAGLNAADRLHHFGQTDIAIVTEGINMGTSRNTGSDKQTYYKLTLSGGEADSITDMAKTLFEGGSMDGDLALIEAAMSVESFFHLTQIGVPFPHNEYGEYVGYKTDHDPRRRATSAGPLTSKYMVECLEKQVRQKDITIYDGYNVIAILTFEGRAVGLLTLNKNSLKDKRYTIFNTANIIYATGGPAGLYKYSVYPESQTGASGIAFEAGVKGKNLTEWQYGIASIKFRWNLSGTFQQVLPCYISTDKNGNDKKEFLSSYFNTEEDMLNAIFLKGYQWPFDVRKIKNNGSSIIDIAVYNEIQKGRRVFLDYTKNPAELKSDFSNLPEEGYNYLKNSDALFGLPIDRLLKMNKPAYELYINNDIDLNSEMLEIAVCAQHNNGGLWCDINYETNISGFYAVGEVCGTHGIYRPGGTALNAGQCASTKAALYIARCSSNEPLPVVELLDKANIQISKKISLCEDMVKNMGQSNVIEARNQIGLKMSRYGAHIRTKEGLSKAITEVGEQLKDFKQSIKNEYELPLAMQNYDLLLCQYVYMSCMLEYIKKGGTSRGSYMIDGKEGSKDLPISDLILECEYRDELKFNWRKVRPIPDRDDWFENVWNRYISKRQ